MTTPTDTLTVTKNTELAFSEEKLALIKRTVASANLTNDELELFLYTCKRTGLDPLARQIYCVKRKGRMVIQTGIDGYRVVAERTGKYAGSDDPEYDGEDQNVPRKAKVTVWKIVGGERCPFSSSARWSEYYPGKGDMSFMWDKMPFLMLGKCAEALALRKAFPQDLSGLYTKEEMDQADGPDTPKLPEKPSTGNVAPKKGTPEVWEEKVLDVEEEERNGKMVYSVRFESGKTAGTLKQELANKAYTLMQNDPDRPLKASIKPGRYPGSFELTEIEP